MIHLSELMDWIDLDTRVIVHLNTIDGSNPVVAVLSPTDYDVNSPNCAITYIEATAKNVIEIYTHNYSKQ